VATLVDGVTHGKALPDDVLDQIAAKTDGVPLFVEELTKMVLEWIDTPNALLCPAPPPLRP
jgi:predicted ATPase